MENPNVEKPKIGRPRKLKVEEINPFIAPQETIKTADFEDYVENQVYKDGAYIYNFDSEATNLSMVLNPEFLESLLNKSLRSSDLIVFLSIISNSSRKTTVVTLNVAKIASKTGYKRSTISSSIKFFKDNGLLEPKKGERSAYWVNPKLLFHGNRIKFLKENNPGILNRISVNTFKV